MGQVVPLEQGDGQPAGGGVQGDPRAGHPGPHDENVDRLAGGQPVTVAGPALAVEAGHCLAGADRAGGRTAGHGRPHVAGAR